MNRKRVHHRCGCTGQTFSSEEWSDYCVKHMHDTREQSIVFTYGTFGFNIHDVCITPNVPVKWVKGQYYFEIRTAQSPNGRWEHGYSYNSGISSCSHPVVFVSKSGEGFPSEKEAVYDALNFLEGRCVREIDESRNRIEYDDDGNVVKNVSALPLFNQMLTQIRRYKEIFNPEQLSLFD